MAEKKNFDSIFEDTKGKSAKKAPAKKAAKKAPAKKAEQTQAAPAAAVAEPKPQAKAPEVKAPFEVDKFKALNTILKNHEQEALYRKGKEDRILSLACGLLAALIFGSMLVLNTDVTGGWFGRLVFRVFFAGAAGLVGVSAGAMIELNRKRLQDILATIVDIHEAFGFFKAGEFTARKEAFFPNTYKFIGSINDDETNYAQLVIKVVSVAAVVAILILS